MNISHHQTGNHHKTECKVAENSGDAQVWTRIDDDQGQVDLEDMEGQGMEDVQDTMMGSVIGEVDHSIDHMMGATRTADSMISTADIIMVADSIT